MKYTSASAGGTVEILAADQFTAIPITVTGGDLVKAGTPLTSAGAAVAATSFAAAAGLLLYDVDPNVNPNGALLVQGVVDGKKITAHAGVTLDETFAVPGIIVRDDIGVNE